MRLIKKINKEKVLKCADGIDRPATNYLLELPLGKTTIAVYIKPVFKDGYRTLDAFAENEEE